MAKLEMLSNVSWRQPFRDRRKEILLWKAQTQVAKFCKLKDGTKRKLRIQFEDKFKLEIEDDFQITSGLEISFPKAVQDKISDIVLNNPESYFDVTVMDTLNLEVVPEKICWLKNINRKSGDWAYEDVSCNEDFPLHWPTKIGGSALTATVGDLIVLFQSPKFINGKKNRKVFLTHIVTPVENRIIPDKQNTGYESARLVKLIAFAQPINAIPNPGYFKFTVPNSGATNKIENLKSRVSLSKSEMQKRLFQLFSDHFCEPILKFVSVPTVIEDLLGAKEGDKAIKEHVKKESSKRNSGIVKKKKALAFLQHNGHIKCECCDTDFLEKYGIVGEGFIECHHKIFLSTGPRITSLQDLALVCSNCHRMLHKRLDHGNYLSVEELKEIVMSNRSNSKR